jgi:hypothetical protein
MGGNNLVTQSDLLGLISDLEGLGGNLNQHVNDPLTQAHGWSLIDTSYLDTGGNFHTDFGQATSMAIPGLFNTGVNADGTLAAGGSVDLHWTLVLSADPSYQGPDVYVASPTGPAWSSNGPNSQWLSPAPNGSQTRKTGSYKYRISFDLAGLNPASAVVKGSWVSDDTTISVILNNVTSGVTGPADYAKQPAAGTTFQFTTGFQEGVNTLDFIVNNLNGPTGFRAEVSGVAQVGGLFAVPTIFSTGMTSAVVSAPLGSVDPHWILYSTPSSSVPGPAYVVNGLDSSWGKNTGTTQWIGPAASSGTAAQPLGDYTYRLAFTLTSFNAGSVVIKGTVLSDDVVTGVLLNGNSTGITNAGTSYKSQTYSFIISSGFNSGSNTLDFVVNNAVTHTGLQVQLSATGSTIGFTPRVLRLSVGTTVIYVPCQVSGGIDGAPDVALTPSTGIVSPQSADPATDVTVGSPAPSTLVTTFSAPLDAVVVEANDVLLAHAGSPAETAHVGLTWQPHVTLSDANYVVGRYVVTITINGVAYWIIGDPSPGGPG